MNTIQLADKSYKYLLVYIPVTNAVVRYPESQGSSPYVFCHSHAETYCIAKTVRNRAELHRYLISASSWVPKDVYVGTPTTQSSVEVINPISSVVIVLLSKMRLWDTSEHLVNSVHLCNLLQ